MKYIFTFLTLSVFIHSNAQSFVDCSTCANETIRNEQIKDLSIDEIRFLINDLYARKGYKFKTSEIDSYFSNKEWYKPVNSNNEIIYNSLEQQNIDFLQQRANVLNEEREKLLGELKKFKLLVLSKNKEALYNKYSYTAENEQFEYLSTALQKIDLDDINWFKNLGFYRVNIDNGELTMEFELKIDKRSISFKNAIQGGSKMGGTLYPNDYNIEYAYWWEFEWNNNSLKFIKINIAG